MKRIMFVCQKNSCRSQMAEGFARASNKGKNFEVVSAGLEASVVHPTAITVMAEISIDISHHSSKLLSKFKPQDFDVVAFVCGSGKTLPPEWYMTEIFQEWMVEDPYEATLEKFREVRDEVREQVDLLLTFLILKSQQRNAIDYQSIEEEI